MKATLLLATTMLAHQADATGGHKEACHLAVFSGKLPSMETEIDCKWQSNSS
jgi:hypothetical protein